MRAFFVFGGHVEDGIARCRMDGIVPKHHILRLAIVDVGPKSEKSCSTSLREALLTFVGAAKLMFPFSVSVSLVRSENN